MTVWETAFGRDVLEDVDRNLSDIKTALKDIADFLKYQNHLIAERNAIAYATAVCSAGYDASAVNCLVDTYLREHGYPRP